MAQAMQNDWTSLDTVQPSGIDSERPSDRKLEIATVWLVRRALLLLSAITSARKGEAKRWESILRKSKLLSQ